MERQQIIPKVTVRQLLDAPTNFDEIAVEITGVLVIEREHRAVYESELSIGKLSIGKREGIWLTDPTAIAGGPKRAGLLSRKVVRIVGTFRNRKKAGTGHFNMWPAELGKISVLEKT